MFGAENPALITLYNFMPCLSIPPGRFFFIFFRGLTSRPWLGILRPARSGRGQHTAPPPGVPNLAPRSRPLRATPAQLLENKFVFNPRCASTRPGRNRSGALSLRAAGDRNPGRARAGLYKYFFRSSGTGAGRARKIRADFWARSGPRPRGTCRAAAVASIYHTSRAGGRLHVSGEIY